MYIQHFNKYKSFLKLKIINETVKGCHITTFFDNVQRRC